MNKVWNGVRWIYASYYFLAGIGLSLILLGLVSIDLDFGKGVNAFLAALEQTGFGLGALAVTYTVSGLLILNNRTAHLGIITLAPVIVIIFLTHWFVEGGDPVWGTTHFSILLALAWRYRRAYLPLFDLSGNFVIKEGGDSA